MSALDLMFQNGMKTQGALAAGQQVGLDQQSAQAQLQAQQLQNQSNQTLNPLRAQMMQGQIDSQAAQTANTQAQLPGMVGQSQSLAAQGKVDADTASAKVAERLSTLSNQIGVNGMQKMERTGQIALAASQALAGFPPAIHKEAFQRIVAQYGGDPNDPTFQSIMNQPPANIAKAAATLGKGMVMASGDYLQKQAIEDSKNASEERRAKIGAGATVEAARIGADSRVQAAQARAAAMAQTMGIDKTIAHYEAAKAANGGTLPPEEEAALTNLKSQQLQVRAAGINPTASNVLGTPSPVAQVAPPRAGPNNSGSFAAGSGQSTTPQGQLKQIGTSGGRPVFEDASGNRFIK